MTEHPIEPVYDEKSRVLILGSFPSIKSREKMFFYCHPQNRFWKVLAAVFERDIPETVVEKKAFLLSSGVAVWDVIASCDVVNSADSSIKNVVPAKIGRILEHAPIEKVFLNGRTAEKYYIKYLRDKVPLEAVCLPSTSPANASWKLDRLVDAWKCIRLDNM